jgi:hypothetical protein
LQSEADGKKACKTTWWSENVPKCISFTFNNWNMEIGTVVKMVHDQCDNAIVNHNLVHFARATEIESELPGCQEIVAKNLS